MKYLLHARYQLLLTKQEARDTVDWGYQVRGTSALSILQADWQIKTCDYRQLGC